MAVTSHRPARRLLTADEEATVRSMIAAGATRDEIAGEIGVTPYVLEHRVRDQLVGVRLKAGRPKGDEAWIDPTGAEDEASRASLELAPWVAARAADLRARWSPERWARAEGAKRPLLPMSMPDIDFTGDDGGA